MPDWALAEALLPSDIADCRALFREYQQGLGVSLDFQGFEAEMAGLPGDYAPPRGRLFIARIAGLPVATAALRPLSGVECEMKRLYVRAEARGTGLGRALARRVIDAASALGNSRIRLDTLPAMGAAQSLYAQLGFRDTAAYNGNPIPGTRFMALDLRGC